MQLLKTFLIAAAVIIGMAFTTGGTYLNVENPAPGVLALDWGFQEQSSTFNVKVAVAATGKSVYSATTASTSALVGDLDPGVYRIEVSNGVEYIIYDEVATN